MMFGGLIRFIRRVAEKVKFSIFIPTNLFQGKERIISQNIVLCKKSRITNNEAFLHNCFISEVEKTHSSNQVKFDNL